jgi:uncharacterized protein YecE (DUF72 family)
MEFGRVSEKQLGNIDFSLPPDPPFNKMVLNGKTVRAPKVYIGCPRWGRKEWLGKIYPWKTKEKDFLEEYVKQYNSIELNATHYKVYATEGIKKWADKAKGKDFLFCPKMYQGITHYGSLLGKEAYTTEFLKGIRAFGPHLGPVFIQMNERFSAKRKNELLQYLGTLPKDLSFFVEVRNPDWFSSPATSGEYFIALRELNMGAVITETPGRRDVVHMQLPINKAYIRYVGNALHPSDKIRIKNWGERIAYWFENGLEEVYIMLHIQPEESYKVAIAFAEVLKQSIPADIMKPTLLI